LRPNPNPIELIACQGGAWTVEQYCDSGLFGFGRFGRERLAGSLQTIVDLLNARISEFSSISSKQLLTDASGATHYRPFGQDVASQDEKI
jgi:hypothetical protein